MRNIIGKIRHWYMSMSKNLKQYFVWPLMITLFSFILTTIFWFYADRASKKASLQEKKLNIISDLTESYQTFYYHSGFRGMMDREQMDFVKYFKNIKEDTLLVVELSIRERILLADSLKKSYPFAYDKMIEGDKEAPKFLKNILLAKLFFNHSVGIKIDSLMLLVPVDQRINFYVSRKLNTNPQKLTEKEKNEILKIVQEELNIKFTDLINEMVKDVK